MKISDLFKPREKEARTVEHVAAITHSHEAVGWRPVQYHLPEDFVRAMTDTADMEAFIADAGADQWNPDYYQLIIESWLEKALQDLESQRTEHVFSIHQIRLYQKASCRDLKETLARMTEELTDLLRKGDEHASRD